MARLGRQGGVSGASNISSQLSAAAHTGSMEETVPWTHQNQVTDLGIFSVNRSGSLWPCVDQLLLHKALAVTAIYASVPLPLPLTVAVQLPSQILLSASVTFLTWELKILFTRELNDNRAHANQSVHSSQERSWFLSSTHCNFMPMSPYEHRTFVDTSRGQ